LARPSDTAGAGFVAPRVLAAFRRDGVGAVLLRALASHLCELGLPAVRASVADPGSLAFAARFGFAETDRQIEQVRSVGAEPVAGRPPAGVQVVLLSDRPGLWSECYERFGCQVLADFATRAALRVSREDWQAHWASDPMFLAVSDGEVIGCAGLDRDPDQPARAEHGLTAVRRDWCRRLPQAPCPALGRGARAGRGQHLDPARQSRDAAQRDSRLHLRPAIHHRHPAIAHLTTAR
jgi:GNAT superfamily N-acetyltransferase